MSRKLTKKQKVALHRLADHYNVMSNLCLALLDENEGGWYNYDDDPIWANSSEGLSIHKRKPLLVRSRKLVLSTVLMWYV